ncbi:MAG: OadG family protein [Anaerolineaceae bacterium]|nr:OadG family protein [Anaerolineaceae bacterium]
MSPDFQTGLMVSVVGLSITFLALFIFIGVIMLLKAIFPYKADAQQQANDESDGESVVAETSCIEDEEVAAAVAAVLFVRGRRSNQLGASLTEGHSPFWTAD